MSRNGTGQYSLPNTVNPVVTDTTITSTWANTTLDDIATELTNSLPRDGQAAPTANLPMGGYKLTGLGTGSASTDSVTYGQVFSSPAFTSPTAVASPAAGDDSLKLATTAFVQDVAMTAALPSQTGNSGKSITTDGTTASWGVSGVAGGGTGQSSYTIGDILYASGATALSKLAASTAGYVLKSNGAGVAPSYSELKTIGGASLLGSGDIVTGISTVGATVTGDYTILTATPTIWPCVTTAIGKCLTAPAANGAGMTKGLFAIIDNSAGGYPVGFRDSAGTLRGAAVAAGGIAHVYLEDTSTAAGTWRVVGTNLEPGLITIDNTFSSTYASTVLKPFVALDDNKSIHFCLNAAGNALYGFVVDKATGAVGTLVLISGLNSCNAAFKVSSTSAIVFYGGQYAVVLSVSGATTLSVGTPLDTGASAYLTAEDFSGAPKIAQLSSTLYLASFTSGANTSVMAISVSGTTVTNGSVANIITANTVSNSTTTYALTATTALVLYKSGAGAPYANNAVVVSVSGTTCTIGTPAALTNCASSVTGAPPSALVSATKCVVADDNNGTGAVAAAVTISGTTVTAGTAFTVEASAIWIGNGYTANSATRYNPHLWTLTTGATNTVGFWYVDSSISRAVVLSESGGTVTAGTILYNSISSAAANTTAGGAILPQGTSDFLSLMKGNVTTAGDPSNLSVVPHKISGTTVTTGPSYICSELGLATSSATIVATRLTSGDYCLFPQVNGGEMLVLRSNGDSINQRGSLPIPVIVTAPAYPRQAVSSNRLVLLLASHATTVAAGTYQLRLLSVEVCQ